MEYYIDFGTNVEVEKVVFFLRADFPHDTYWKAVDVEFDDGTRETANFIQTHEGQELILKDKKTTRKIHLTNFKQAVFPFSWAALSQIEVYGRYMKEDLSKMEIRCASNPKDVKHYTTERLREEFHISKLFTKDNIRMVYSHIDRIITAGLMPVYRELKLEGGKELARQYYFEIVNYEMNEILKGRGKKDAFTPAPNLKEFLLTVKKEGIKIGLVTSGLYEKAMPEIISAFKQLDMGNPVDFYDSIITAGQALRKGQTGTLGELAPKPHPWLYAETARVGLGIPFERRHKVLGIEDSSAGVVSIKLAGFSCTMNYLKFFFFG